MTSSSVIDGEDRHRLALDEKPKLKCVADQLQVNVSDLHAPFGNGAYQPFGLEARDQFTDRAEGQAGVVG